MNLVLNESLALGCFALDVGTLRLSDANPDDEHSADDQQAKEKGTTQEGPDGHLVIIRPRPKPTNLAATVY